VFESEAAWIEETLAAVPDESLGTVLDVGSADLAFRTVDQPWIDERIHGPLAARAVPVVFADVKTAPGIDLVADLMTEAGLADLRGVDANTVLCCNVLEHVEQPAAFASRLGSLVGRGGRLVITVPHSYPHHADPIDTMFRPDIDELVGLVDGFDTERAAILSTGSYRDDFARRPVTLTMRHLFRLPFPFLGWHRWKRSVTKLKYLVKPYRVTCVCLRKG